MAVLKKEGKKRTSSRSEVQKKPKEVTVSASQTEDKQGSTPFITEYDMFLFGSGTHYDIYEKLGSHPVKKDGKEGYYFAVWAPGAREVYLIGSFNDWDESRVRMQRQEPLGIYDCFLEGIKPGELYKYLIIDQNGEKQISLPNKKPSSKRIPERTIANIYYNYVYLISAAFIATQNTRDV